MSQRNNRTIDVSFDIVDISQVQSSVRQNIRTIDVEFVIISDKHDVTVTETVVERSINISLFEVNLNVDMSDYDNTDKQTQVIIDSFIKGDKGDKSVKRITKSEFDKLVATQTLDLDSFYFVTNDYDTLRYIYAGDLLIAKSNEDGSFAFPYIFPLTF